MKIEELEEKPDPKENMLENIVAIAIVLILAGAAGWWGYAQLHKPVVAPEERVQIPLGTSPLLGDINAPLTVVIFSDFECPFCGAFARDEFPSIKERFIDTGQVRLVYKQYPLDTHPHSLLAAEAAACAQDQDAFWEYHDALYAHQDALEVGNLLSYAQELGLDMDAFRPCLINEERKADVLRDKQLGIDIAVTGTPTFFFDGRRVVGALTETGFAAEVA